MYSWKRMWQQCHFKSQELLITLILFKIWSLKGRQRVHLWSKQAVMNQLIFRLLLIKMRLSLNIVIILRSQTIRSLWPHWNLFPRTKKIWNKCLWNLKMKKKSSSEWNLKSNKRRMNFSITRTSSTYWGNQKISSASTIIQARSKNIVRIHIIWWNLW